MTVLLMMQWSALLCNLVEYWYWHMLNHIVTTLFFSYSDVTDSNITPAGWCAWRERRNVGKIKKLCNGNSTLPQQRQKIYLLVCYFMWSVIHR